MKNPNNLEVPGVPGGASRQAGVPQGKRSPRVHNGFPKGQGPEHEQAESDVIVGEED